MLGLYKNFEELEDSLTLEEMNVILEASRKSEFRKQQFAASLKGVDLPEPETEELTFEDIKRRAEARISGVSEESISFAEVGVMIVEE